MRLDIQKVLVERPRHRDRDFNRAKPGERTKRCKPVRTFKLELVEGEDGEEILDVEHRPCGSMSRFAKELTDFLSPLRGWARQQAGRPYDVAMRDVHRLLRGNGVQQQHVRQHIHDFILPKRKVVILDGRACHAPYRRQGLEISEVELYEDPRDGIKWGKGKVTASCGALRTPPSYSHLQGLPKKDNVPVPLPDRFTCTDRYLIRKEGVWYYSYTLLTSYPGAKARWETICRQASLDRLRDEGFRRPR